MQIQRCAINFIVLDSRGHQDSGASKASDQENDRLLHRAYAHAVGRWQAGHGPIFLSSSFKDLQSFCEQPSCSCVRFSLIFNLDELIQSYALPLKVGLGSWLFSGTSGLAAWQRTASSLNPQIEQCHGSAARSAVKS